MHILRFIALSTRLPATMAAFAMLAAAAVASAADPLEPAQPPAHGKEVLVVKDDQATKTIDAKGQDVTVNGNRNKLTITGECHALTISGDLNFVSVEAVSSITIAGGGNQVAYQKAVDGEKPQLTDNGKDNTIAKKKVE